MSGEVSRYSIDEDPYAEKDRLQKQFIKDNPQEELSRLLQAIGKTGSVDDCPAGTMDIGPVEVPAAEWRLTSSTPVATAGVLPGGQQPASKAPTQQQKEVEQQAKMIQALTDGTFDKVCVDSGAGESLCPVSAFPSYETVQTSKTGKN